MAEKSHLFPENTGMLQRILEEPRAVALIQSLDAVALGKLIRHIGLEEAGGLIALATTGQLAKIFDQDLWRNFRPGQEEKFDSERFAVWLEVMLEADPRLAARKLAEMDEDFVVLALDRYILVLEADAFKHYMMSLEEDEERLIDKALESGLCFEFSRHLVIAKNDRAWDAVLMLLAEMEQAHADAFEQRMDRLSRLSAVGMEQEGGLYSLLTAAQQLEEDVADVREERRQAEGFVSPTEAAHFLYLARREDREDVLASLSRKALSDLKKRAKAFAAAPLESLADWLAGQELPEIRQALLPGKTGQADAEWMLHTAMAHLASKNRACHAQRLLEFSHLANVLIAGCQMAGRRFRPFEAGQAAVAVCNLGLEQIAGKSSPDKLAVFLEAHDGIDLFRRGWRLLHTQVSMAVTENLRDALNRHLKKQLKKPEPRLKALADRLNQCLKVGKPWEAGPALAELSTLLDEPTIASLRVILGECPLVPVATQAEQGQGVFVQGGFIHTFEQLEQARQAGAEICRQVAEEKKNRNTKSAKD